MRRKESVTVYLITGFVSVFASPGIIMEDFKEVTILQDRIEMNHGISVHRNSTLSGCAALCLKNGNCWSFFYNNANFMCRLIKSPFLDVSQTSRDSGFRHYSRDFCPSQFPTIPHTSLTVSYSGTPYVEYNCKSSAIYISGNRTMACDIGTLIWITTNVVCKDKAPYISKGYTEFCGTVSVMKFVGTKVIFDVAKQACRQDGAHLARPRTPDRWKCLADYAETKTARVHVWMDITDRNVENTFVFSDSSVVPPPYPWLPGEPHPSFRANADCVGIWPDLRQWDDLPCGNVAEYICEIEF